MTPEHMIKVLDEERRNWLETADAFDRLKTYLTGTFSLRDADGNAQLCRQRAEKLQEIINQLQLECQLDSASLAKEDPRPPYLQ